MTDKRKRSFFTAMSDLILGLEDEDLDEFEDEDLDEFEFEKTVEEDTNTIKEAESVKEDVETIKEEKDTESIISKSMIINGNIASESNTYVYGMVIGDITCNGHLYIAGTVTGTINADSLIVNSGRVNGSITVKNKVTIEDNSEMHGDIVANILNTNGFIDGNINANEVVLLSKAVVNGDIYYQNLAIETGAKLKGIVNIINE